jgi:hypothetical protein
MIAALAAMMAKKTVPAMPGGDGGRPPTGGNQQQRLTIDQITATSWWAISNIANLQWTGVIEDQSVERHASANGANNVWFQASFPTPLGYPLGTQKFVVRAAASASGMNIVVALYEAGTFKANLATVALTTSAAVYEIPWDASLLSDNTGAGVEIRITLQDSVANQYYTFWWVAWDVNFSGTPVGAEWDTELPVAAVNATNAWSITDLPDIQDYDAANPDATTSDRGSANGATVWARFDFDTPPAPLTGTQTFKVRARGSSSGLNIIVKVAENGTVKKTFATQALTTSFTTYTFTWDASILSDSSGAGVQIEVHLSDSVASQVYFFSFISWVAHMSGAWTGLVVNGQLKEPFQQIDLNTSGTTDLTRPWNFYFEQANLRTFTNHGARQYWTRDGETKGGNTISGHLTAAGHGSPPHLHKIVDGVLRLQAYPAPSALANALTTELGGYQITHVAGMISTERSLARSRGIWSVRVRRGLSTRGVRLLVELVPSNGSQSPKIRFADLCGVPFLESDSPQYRTELIGWTNNPSFLASGAVRSGQMVRLDENAFEAQNFHTYEVQINDDGQITFSRDGIVSRIQENQFPGTSWYLAIALEANSTMTAHSPAAPTYVEVDHVDIRAITPTIRWPAGWPAQPPLRSFHGIGVPFNFYYNEQGQLVWQPLRDYNAWLGRPANICKVWSNWDRAGSATWDDVAGGAGTSDSTWAGQLNELNPNRAFDPNYWPVTDPIVFGLTGVPYSHSNQRTGSSWGRPGIWQEIARGDYDQYYVRLFRRIAYRCGQIGRDPRTVVIRWNWEANGDWYSHSIGPDKAGFINAWRRCMDLMRKAVGSVLGAGKSFMIEFGPSRALRFGDMTSERLWNIYPGDDWVDIVGLGIHDFVGIKVQADWDSMLHYPDTRYHEKLEGILDWFDFGISRGKWVGTSEIESNYVPRKYFPKTENMHVMWTTGFEPVRQRYDGKFLYFIYLWTGASAMNRPDNWGQPYKDLYGP